jgi:LemA protein
MSETGLYVLLGVAAVILLWFFGTYNGLVRLRQHIRESWRGIDIQLKRRYDLIPNLVETVKGYARHERDLLERLATARAKAAANNGPVASQEADERPVVQSLRQVLALQESYPELKADRNFLALQEELVDTEDRIAAARRFFNGNVREMRNLRESFPTSVVGGAMGIELPTFFELDDANERVVPRVDLGAAR